ICKRTVISGRVVHRKRLLEVLQCKTKLPLMGVGDLCRPMPTHRDTGVRDSFSETRELRRDFECLRQFSLQGMKGPEPPQDLSDLRCGIQPLTQSARSQVYAPNFRRRIPLGGDK